MSRVALATCAELPDGDPDDHVLRGAFAGGAEFVVWDDPAVDWDAFDAVLLRSTWDYARRRDAFLRWADAVGDRLVNPPDVVRWNTDKRYLAELPHAVPTAFLDPGEPLREPDAAEYVLKPTVSAGSKDTARFAPGDPRAVALLEAIHRSGRTAMVQPYLASVDAHGETALVHVGGTFSHAIRKGPLLRPGEDPAEGLFAEEDIVPRTPPEDELALAAEVLAAAPGHPHAYARVDVVRGDDGRPMLLELELCEPSLFLAHAPAGTAARLAAAVHDAVTR